MTYTTLLSRKTFRLTLTQLMYRTVIKLNKNWGYFKWIDITFNYFMRPKIFQKKKTKSRRQSHTTMTRLIVKLLFIDIMCMYIQRCVFRVAT